MPVELHWQAIALRLTLTLLAGILLGIDRSKHGHPAGLRTTLLVTLAASIAMIQMNLLLPTNGKPSNSYAVMDLMRLPLGILTGVGFIGAGAIIRKDERVLGVTTASTMWFATVTGLCLGGGQLILGSVAAVLGYLVLTVLRWVENLLNEEQRGSLVILIAAQSLSLEELWARLEADKLRVKSVSTIWQAEKNRRRIECDLRWPSSHGVVIVPQAIWELEQLPGVMELEWHPGTMPDS
jgi:putative Mg2+ transporter-C (MgtC) family protein